MVKKNRITAAILAILTGFIGGHKLYLRDKGGFIMFFFLFIASINIFNAPLTSLLGVFDAFRLFSMTDEEFNRKYNKGIIRPRTTTVDRRRAEQIRRYQSEDAKKGFARNASNRRAIRHNPFKSSGLAKYKEFELEEAIEDFQKGLEITPNDIALHFNLACAYSLTEQKDLSYQYLSKAVALGFNDYERIMSHDDLAFMRIQPEFDGFKTSGFRDYQGKANKQSEESNVKVAEQTDDVLLSQLSRLAELRKKGILSEEEFLTEKNKLMRR